MPAQTPHIASIANAAPGTAGPDPIQARAKRRITWAGLLVNLPLSLGKIFTGWFAGSQALVADGVHSLADMASDVTVLWALTHSARGPDNEHPYGHGRFETLATLAVAAALALAAVGLLIDAGTRLFAPVTAAPPTVLALVVAGISLLTKEILYHVTVRVGRNSGSSLIIANAWHHRSDALSSVVAAAGIAGGMAGYPLLDPLAAAVIAAMLLRVAWSHGRPAVHELVDTQATGADRRAIEQVLRATPGVTGLRALRVRQHGNALSADASLLVDPEITVTEGHRISEAAHASAVEAIAALDHIILHVEPDGHAEGFGATSAPLRGEVEQALRDLVHHRWPTLTLREIRLGYFDDGITVDLVASLCRDDRNRQTELGAEITHHLRSAQPAIARVNLHCASDSP